MSVQSFISRSFTLACWLAICSGNGFAMEGTCARTPALALRTAHGPATGPLSMTGPGYRIKAVRWDPLLRQRWAMISSCEHPDRPAVALPIVEPFSSHQVDVQRVHVLFPVVHAGDLLQLWRQEENLRIEVAGRAEENGAEGSRIRVRLLSSSFDMGQEQTVIGIVRGPGDVEMNR